MTHDSQVVHCFRPGRSQLVSGVFVVVLGVCFGSLVFTAVFADESGWYGVTVPTAAMLIFGAWMILDYFRRRVFLDDASIAFQGVLFHSCIPFAEVLHVEWDLFLNGRIILRT